MSNHNEHKDAANKIPEMSSGNWNSINPEYVARMRMQNKFKTGVDIAKYTAAVMRRDMEEYDNDTSAYTRFGAPGKCCGPNWDYANIKAGKKTGSKMKSKNKSKNNKILKK